MRTKVSRPKILILDIEWRPIKAWVWRCWDETVSPEQVIEDGGLLCVGMKWYGTRERFFFSDWQHGKKKMLRETRKLMAAADAIVTYNGDKYDLPKLSGEFLRYGFMPPATAASIDLIKTVKKQGYAMNRLAYVSPFLGLGGKLSHEGFSLWKKVMAGCPVAIKRMTRYCMKDVSVTEQLYKKVLPFIKNHPHLNDTPRACCGACGSNHTHSHGYRRTKACKIQRIHCVDCGSWQDGTKTKV